MGYAVFFVVTLAIGSAMDLAGVSPPAASTFEWWVGLNLLMIVYALVKISRTLDRVQRDRAALSHPSGTRPS